MLNNFYFYLLCWLAFTNLCGFAAMGLDKWKAKNNQWRIPEKTLFTWALLGGSIGSIIGMQYFRHKTKHLSFVIGMPLILVLQIAAGLYFLFR